MTGHAEGVLVVLDLDIISCAQLFTTLSEKHDLTQGIRQGNRIGTS